MKISPAYLFILLTGIGGIVCAQEQSQAILLQESLDSLWIERPVEKLYVQFDKEQYVPGEIVWFKVYLLEGKSHIPSYLSTVAYVECWNEVDSLIDRKIISLIGGEGQGDFTFDSSLPGGTYRIRAYTQWMRNSQAEFQHALYVFGEPIKKDSLLPPPSRPDIQFLPESGVFLAGCKNRMGIKALGDQGLGISVKGIIKDQAQVVVDSFFTSHRGMGTVSFEPLPGQVYSAECIWAGDTLVYPLPSVENEGVRMHIDPSAFLTKVDIHLAGASESFVQLVGVTRGELTFFARMKLVEGQNLLDIPNSSFPTGVLQLTLRDEQGRPLCERMCWIDKKDQLDIEIDPPLLPFGKRSKVQLPIHAFLQDGGPFPASVSVSIVSETGYMTQAPYRKSLPSYALWAAEARGNLEAPWEYFHGGEVLAEKIDLVMLTHFWRKVHWGEMTSPTLPAPEFMIERGMRLTGQARKPNKKPFANAPLVLMIDGIFNMRETQTDDEGRFAFDGVYYVDTSQIFLQIKNEKDKQRPATFEFDSPVSPPPPTFLANYARLLREQEDRAYIQQVQSYVNNRKLVDEEADYELEAVEITGERAYTEAKYDLKRMYVRTERVFRMDEIGPVANLIEVLRGEYPSFNIVGGPGNYRFQSTRAYNPLSSREPGEQGSPVQPSFYIDGIETPLTFVESFPVDRVDFIDLVLGDRAVALGNPVGIVAIYTKDGEGYENPQQDQLKGRFNTQLPGYSLSRTFYQPNYEVPSPNHDLPDLRNTLLWEPKVQIDGSGMHTLEFFSGDIPGRYKVVVEGVSPDGQLGYGEAWIEIK